MHLPLLLQVLPSQQQIFASQQSVAMSSQRTAQYHWDTGPNASLHPQPSATQLPHASSRLAAAPQAGLPTQMSAGQPAPALSQRQSGWPSTGQHANALPSFSSQGQRQESRKASRQVKDRPNAAEEQLVQGRSCSAAAYQLSGSTSTVADDTVASKTEVCHHSRLCPGA